MSNFEVVILVILLATLVVFGIMIFSLQQDKDRIFEKLKYLRYDVDNKAHEVQLNHLKNQVDLLSAEVSPIKKGEHVIYKSKTNPPVKGFITKIEITIRGKFHYTISTPDGDLYTEDVSTLTELKCKE